MRKSIQLNFPADDPAVPQRVLDVARWPEKEPEWDLEGWDEILRGMSPSHLLQADRDNPGPVSRTAGGDTPPRRESLSHPFRVRESRDTGGHAATVAGAVVGLLLIAGSIYAYEIFSAKPAVREAVSPAADRTPDTGVVPPSRLTNSLASGAAGRPDTTVIQATQDEDPPAPHRAARATRRKSPSATDALSGPLDAPMTLTPETAPPPQPLTSPAVPR
jgi:hypothetical protein